MRGDSYSDSGPRVFDAVVVESRKAGGLKLGSMNGMFQRTSIIIVCFVRKTFM